MFNLTVDIDDIVAQFKPRSTHVVLGLGIVPNWKNLQIKKTSRAECLPGKDEISMLLPSLVIL